jgi:hypothetical protein
VSAPEPQVPDFLGIGVPRAGTTWLHELLAGHPEVYVPARRKEVSYFDLYYDRGPGWYRKFFPAEEDRARYRAIGEITPYYYYDEACPERIAGAGIQRLILLLRHPTERAWSYYGQKIRNGMFRGSFEEFLQQTTWPVVEQGRYSRYFRRYLRHFDRERILVLVFEEAVADPTATQGALAGFLGISRAGFAGAGATSAVNSSYVPRSPRLYGVAFRLSKMLRRHDLDWVVNAAKRLGVRQAFGARGTLGEMRPDTRASLDALFQAEIDELEDLIGIPLEAWRERAAPADARRRDGADGESFPLAR